MAVLVEALSVVIKAQSIVGKFKGGTEAFMSSIPNSSLCADGELVCLSFMVPTDAKTYVQFLEFKGLTHLSEGRAIDCVVVDQNHGPASVCDWIQFGEVDWNDDPAMPVSVCSTGKKEKDFVFIPEGWSYENSITKNSKYISCEEMPKSLKFVQTQNGVDILIDEATGMEYYIKRV